MQNLNEGLLFDPALSAEIKDRFYLSLIHI